VAGDIREGREREDAPSSASQFTATRKSGTFSLSLISLTASVKSLLYSCACFENGR